MSLDDLFRAAAARELAEFRIGRAAAGTKHAMWQASARCTGDTAYRVAIEPDLINAIAGVLTPRPSDVMPAPVPAAAAPAAEDLFG